MLAAMMAAAVVGLAISTASAVSAFAQSPSSSTKLAGIKSFRVEGGIVRAVFCGESAIVVTQGDAGTFRVISLPDGKQQSFRSEGGERRRFEPTLIAPLGDEVAILDEARWQVHRFSLDGNSLKQFDLPSDGAVGNGAGDGGRPVGLASEASALLVLDFDGGLRKLNWQGEVLGAMQIAASQLTQLRYDAATRRVYILQPLAGRIISIPIASLTAGATGEGGDESAESAAKVGMALTIPQQVLGSELPVDFALLADGRMLVTVGSRLFVKSGDDFTAVELPAGFNEPGAVRVETSGSRVLLYNHAGEMLVGELK